ncbi:penicillin-binding protein 1A [Rhizobium sp. ZK1]|uniref:penicillin-binding protein 1A n=1 Tax=Rhizobium sp. ZK1 TaxID=3389872 RepID=UPI0039F74284
MVRLLGYFFGIACVGFLGAAAVVAVYLGSVTKDLPDYAVLSSYEPPVTTRVHAGNGALMAEYAKQRRLFLPIQAVPDRVKAAFLSAEDKNFYQHPGIDITGFMRAVVAYLTGGPTQGGSTITQQVAKNFLLSSEQTMERKAKEAILSFRIEQAYSKDKILELYLNEIFFGLNSYGVASASLTYFNKSVSELTIAEAAYLASLPKGPANYHPFRHPDAAITRRNWVIDRMVENGYVSQSDGEDAKKQPLGVTARNSGSSLFASDYFAEAVRRQLIDQYGEKALYEGGLSVRTSLDPQMQLEARKALQDGLITYDERRGFHGPIKQISTSGDWGPPLAEVPALSDVPEWRLAVVLAVSNEAVDIGLQPPKDGGGKVAAVRERGTIAAKDMQWAFRSAGGDRKTTKSPVGAVSAGDVVYVERLGGDGSTSYRLRQPPKVQGGLVAMDPKTGRVLAMVGGFSYAQSEFNRATQAMRQPGSSFKPFVYAAAMDNGYTPASVIMDAPIEIVSGGQVWKPENYGGEVGGPSTLRSGIENSRNLMTVRLANDLGMNIVAEYAERFGIYDKMAPLLAMSLGSGETTVLRMVSAYSVIANGGKQIKPTLIDRIQDRYGKTIFKHEERLCEGCNAGDWQSQDEPNIVDNREQVLDPMTSYQITSMMQGVIQRGTAAGKIDLSGRDVAGKTGTTNDEKDAWFVGFTPDLVAGLYMGFDTPAPLGRGGTGGGLSAPIFNEFMQAAVKDMPESKFVVPAGMNMIAINRKTGMAAVDGDPGTIIEAFKPGTGPADSLSVIGMDGTMAPEEILRTSPQANQAVQTNTPGLF